ncbi:hypothetical protein ACFL17_06560 [Pseudomonadota bacterium]
MDVMVNSAVIAPKAVQLNIGFSAAFIAGFLACLPHQRRASKIITNQGEVIAGNDRIYKARFIPYMASSPAEYFSNVINVLGQSQYFIQFDQLSAHGRQYLQMPGKGVLSATTPIRRLIHDDAATGDKATLEARSGHEIVIDIDGASIPNWDPTDLAKIEAGVRWALKKMNYPDASVVWQITSSQKLPINGGSCLANIRLYLLCDLPLTQAVRERFIVTLDPDLCADSAIHRNNQICYTSPPTIYDHNAYVASGVSALKNAYEQAAAQSAFKDVSQDPVVKSAKAAYAQKKTLFETKNKPLPDFIPQRHGLVQGKHDTIPLNPHTISVAPILTGVHKGNKGASVVRPGSFPVVEPGEETEVLSDNDLHYSFQIATWYLTLHNESWTTADIKAHLHAAVQDPNQTPLLKTRRSEALALVSGHGPRSGELDRLINGALQKIGTRHQVNYSIEPAYKEEGLEPAVAQQELLQEIATMKPGDRIALQTPPGLGKTSAILKHTVKNNIRTDVYTPSHALAEQGARGVIALGGTAQVIYGRTHDIGNNQQLCQRYKLVEMLNSMNIPSVNSLLCKRRDILTGKDLYCPHHALCPYIHQFYTKATHVFRAHNWLSIGETELDKVRMSKPNVVLIDENPLDKLVGFTHMTLGHLKKAANIRTPESRALAAIVAGALFFGQPIFDKLYANAKAECLLLSPYQQNNPDQYLLDQLEKAVNDSVPKPPYISPDQSDFEIQTNLFISDPGDYGIYKLFVQLMDAWVAAMAAYERLKKKVTVAEAKFRKWWPQRHARPEMVRKWIGELRQCRTAVKSPLELVVCNNVWYGVDSGGVDAVHVAWTDKIQRLHRDAKVFVTDATMNLAGLQKVIPRLKHISIRVRQNAQVIQITDQTFSKSKISNAGPEVTDTIGWLNQLKNAGVCSPKSFETLRGKTNNVAHFGALRGLNSLAHVDTLVVVGRNQPGVLDIERVARALYPFDELNLPGKWDPQPRGYRMRDGTTAGVLVDMHPDPRVMEILEVIREGEVQQAIGRARTIWSITPKRICLLTNLPVDVTVDRLTTLRELIGPKRLARLLDQAHGVLPLSAKLLATWPGPEFQGEFKNLNAAKKWLRYVNQWIASFPYKKKAPSSTGPFPYKNQRGPFLIDIYKERALLTFRHNKRPSGVPSRALVVKHLGFRKIIRLLKHYFSTKGIKIIRK